MTPPVPLNLFQRLLRQWDRVHPYNAGQVMQVRGSIDASRATQAWHEALRSLGLGTVRVGRSDFVYEEPTGTWRDRPVAVVPDARKLEVFLTDQLNRPFDDPEEPPFRPFIVPGTDGTCHIGVMYQHWLADSVSIRQLMREWFCRLFDPTLCTGAGAIRHARHGYWSQFGPWSSNWPFVLGLVNTFRRYFRHRRVMKIDGVNISDPVVHLQLHELTGVMSAVASYARQHNAKVNDVFVAALADLCRLHVPLQRRGKRQDISIGSIVDLRPHTNEDLRNVFGIFLGFNSVVVTPDRFRDWPTLLAHVAKQNAMSKDVGMTQTSLIWMVAAAFVGYFGSPRKLFHFYRKDLPLAGGVSNVNLNPTWVSRYHPDPILSYARISPAGPMTPIVFSTTTLGDNLQVSVTFRRGLIGDDRASAMSAGFFERLKSLTSPPIQGQ